MRANIVIAIVACLLQLIVGSTEAASVKFSKMNWNEYKVGASPDVKKDFAAPWSGCTGFLLGGKPCNPTGGNHGSVKANPAGSGNVMKLTYLKGKSASLSGGQFYRDVKSLNNVGELEYEVFIPKSFQWKKGGKLPGLYGGNKECSGSKVRPNGKNCFSTRLMWRENGIGEVYMYLPFKENPDTFCKQCAYPVGNKCSQLSSAEYCAWARGSFRFQAGSWNRIKQVVKLNTPGKADGTFELFHNGRKVAAHYNVVYRTTSSLKVSGLLFSSFYGGEGKMYAPTSDQELLFRNIKVSG